MPNSETRFIRYAVEFPDKTMHIFQPTVQKGTAAKEAKKMNGTLITLSLKRIPG